MVLCVVVSAFMCICDYVLRKLLGSVCRRFAPLAEIGTVALMAVKSIPICSAGLTSHWSWRAAMILNFGFQATQSDSQIAFLLACCINIVSYHGRLGGEAFVGAQDHVSKLFVCAHVCTVAFMVSVWGSAL